MSDFETRIDKAISSIDSTIDATRTMEVIDDGTLDISAKYIVATIKGRKFRFKTPPLNVLDFVSKILNLNLYPEQKETLVALRGTDPLIWDTSTSELLLLIGQRGGKNLVMQCDAAYQAYYLGNVVGDPYELMSLFCGKEINRTDNFEITNNSIAGSDQAKSVFFERIKTTLRSAMYEGENWFAKYMRLNLSDDGLGDMKAKEISFPRFAEDTGRIILYSLDSKRSSPEGKTILTGYIDEPSRADTKATYENAKTLYGVVSRNTEGSFPEGVGKTVAFSYPNMSEYDLMWELVEDARIAEEEFKREHPDTIYESSTKYFIFSTFQFNKSIKENSPSMQKKLKRDPDAFNTAYKCQKVKTKDAFFKPYIHKIRECVIPSLQNTITYHLEPRKRVAKDGTTKKYMAIIPDQIKGDNRIRAVAADFSINKARSVMMSGYNELMENERDESIIKIMKGEESRALKNKVIIDTMLIWEPTKEFPVDYWNANEMIEVMLNNFPNIQKFSCDVYQLSFMAAAFEVRGVKTEAFQFKADRQYEYYSNYKIGISNDFVGYLNVELFLEEAERVQRGGKSGRGIEPGHNFTKDIIDTAVILYETLNDLSFEEESILNGIDGFTDGRIMDWVARKITLENEAVSKGLRDVDGYIMSKLMITPDEYTKLCEAENELNEYY